MKSIFLFFITLFGMGSAFQPDDKMYSIATFRVRPPVPIIMKIQSFGYENFTIIDKTTTYKKNLIYHKNFYFMTTFDKLTIENKEVLAQLKMATFSNFTTNKLNGITFTNEEDFATYAEDNILFLVIANYEVNKGATVEARGYTYNGELLFVRSTTVTFPSASYYEYTSDRSYFLEASLSALDKVFETLPKNSLMKLKEMSTNSFYKKFYLFN